MREDAEDWFRKAKEINLAQSSKPEASVLAQSYFREAARRGHPEALRDLAGMLFDGRGSPRDQAGALLLLWGAIQKSSVSDDLERLSELMASYSEELGGDQGPRLTTLAEGLDRAVDMLRQASYVMDEFARKRRASALGDAV